MLTSLHLFCSRDYLLYIGRKNKARVAIDSHHNMLHFTWQLHDDSFGILDSHPYVTIAQCSQSGRVKAHKGEASQYERENWRRIQIAE
ncbi:hypothetical protein K1719_001163 [Acacia pycnantha]|nr:hypothetical protein K1719_001163 [Acacia pycnantha]